VGELLQGASVLEMGGQPGLSCMYYTVMGPPLVGLTGHLLLRLLAYGMHAAIRY
jgi:hypothetical protein